MQISDLMSDHSAALKIHNPVSASFWEQMTTANVNSLYVGGLYACYMTMFSFRTGKTTTSAANGCISMHLVYSSVWVKVQFETHYIQSSNTYVNGRLKYIYPGGSLYSTYFNINVGGLYAICYSMGTTATGWNFGVYSVDSDGHLSEVMGMQNSMNSMYTHPLTLNMLVTRDNYYGTMLVYEPMYLGSYASRDIFKDMVPRLWTGSRSVINTYYGGNYTWYMLPPIDDMDGVAYDRTAVTEWQISEHDDVLALTDDTVNAIDAALANRPILSAIVAALPSITNQDSILSKISDLFDTIGDIFDQGGDKIAHFKAILTDPIGAIKANLWRMFKSFLDDRRDLPE